MRTLKNTQLKKYGLFFYAVENDFRSYLQFQVCVRASTIGGAIGNFPEEEGPTTHDNKIPSHNHDNHNNVTKAQSADLKENEVPVALPTRWPSRTAEVVGGGKEISSTFSTSEITTEKILDVVFYYQELIVEWVKRVSPRPSPFTLACGATLYLVAVCTAIQRQEGDRWFSVFIDSKVPGLSEPSQKSMWDSFENVTSQYVTLNQKAKTLDSHTIGTSPKMMGQPPASTSKGVRQVDPVEENSETQSLCDSSVISRVDLYKKRVLIRLKSPWDKQSRQQYAGLFYDQNKLEGFAKMNRGKVLPDTVSSLPGTHKTFLQNPSRGIQSWYKIEARNDDNPILLSQGVTTKKEKNFYDNNINKLSTDVLDFAAPNPLEKTKNWFVITHNMSLWDYFPLLRSQEQVYFGGDNVPSKLDSALFSSSFQSSSAKQPEPCFGSSLETGQKPEGYTFSKAKIDENLFLEEKTEDNNKNQSRAEIIEHLYMNKPKFSLSNLGLGAKRETLVEEKVKAFSEKSTRSASQFQKLPLNLDNTFGFTCCDFGEFNFSPSVLRPAPSVSSSTHKRVRENDLVGVSYFSNHSYKTSMNGRSLPEANISDKPSLSKQILDPQKLKVWFETNKDLANGDEIYGFENKLKSLFYSKGVLPFPELGDIDDELFELDDIDDELFEESENKQEKSLSDLTKKGQESSASELLPFSEQRDEAGFEEYHSSEEESALGEEAINFLPVSKQNLFSQDFNDNISDVPSLSTDVSRSAPSFASTSPPEVVGGAEGSDESSQDFLPSHFYKNTWISPRFMSGYKFPELTKKDIFRLQTRFVIHHFLPSLTKACIGLEKDSFFTIFNTQKLASKISLLPLEIQLPPVLPAYLFRDMFSPSFFNSFLDQQGALCAAFTDPPETTSQERVKIPELKLAYRVIQLEEKKEVEKAFTKFGRDYNEYLTYPKEGLRALKVSPSLEDEEKNEESLEEAREKDRKGELGKIIRKFAYRRGYAVKKEKETSDLPDINNSDLNPWISSLWGPDNMLSDRKTSFLGIKNVLRKRLISRERQDIAAEILNVKNPPLTKLRTRARRNDILLIGPTKLETKNDVASQHHVVEVNSFLRKKRVVATNIVTPFEAHHIMPEISKTQWRKMIEYQIRSYFFEEDNRLEPLVKKNPHHHFKIQRVNTFLPWVIIRTPKEKTVEWPITRLDYEKIDGTKQDFLLPKYSTINANSYVKTHKFQAPPDSLARNIISKQKGTLSFRKREANSDSFFSFPDSSALRADDNFGVSSSATQNQHTTQGQYRWVPSKLREWANYVLEEINKFKLASSRSKKVLSQQLTFEPFTKHSWLLIYRFFLVFAVRDVGKYLYRVTLKDFLIGMAHTHFGLAVTSEEFRKWLQHVPPKLFYKPHKRLQDVVGLQHVIPALDDIIWFLRNSGRGRGVARGVILVGPPGTGKTVLVQAIAGEAQVPVVVQSMSSLSIPDPEKRPHERLQEMFQIARQQAPCILFMDEIDRIAESRGGVVTNDIGPPDSLICLEADIGGEPSYALQTELLPKGDTSLTTKELKDVSLHQEKKEREARRVNILLRLLTEIDGLRSLNGVVLIATTNRPAVLDPALLRPGRFSKMIYLQLPSHQKRIDLFKLHTKKIGSPERMPWDYLASRTADMSGTDIAAAINHSAIRAILANTVHTLETLEQGLNYVTGAPVSFAPLADFAMQSQEIKNRVRAGLGGRETNSKAAFAETTKGGPEFRSAYRKTKMSKILHARVSEKLADTVYAVYGVFNQKVYTPKLYSQKLAFPVKKHFSERIKEACNTSRIAYYQAGKGVVQSVLPTHPNVGFLALSPDTNNESPFTKTSWDKITSSQLNHRKVDLETKIIGLYAGKAGEMLHLNVNSFKNYSSPQLADHNQTWLYKAKSARPVSTNGSRWLSQSNLGFSELLFASSLAHVMIDRWYLYSKRMFSLKTNRLTMALNEEEIFNDDLFPMFAKLCGELDRDRPKESTSSSSKEQFVESEQMYVSRAEKEGGVHALLEGIEQQNIILAWWQDQMYKRIEMSDKPYSQWYRIYLPKPEERERNEEWVAPDFYYHQDLDLASITQDQSNAIDAIKLRSKTLHKVLTQNPTRLSPLQKVVAQNNQESGGERKKFVFLPKKNKIKITKPGNPHHQPLQNVDGWRQTPEVVTLYSRPISLSVQAAKTWNDMYWLERDYSYHQLVTTCFYTSFLHLDENRELLDFLADHLIRFQKLRKHEILRICSLFQVKTCSEQYLTLGSKADKQKRQDQINTDKKNVILSENSAPFIPSWWEQKTVNEALVSSFTGPPSADTRSTWQTPEVVGNWGQVGFTQEPSVNEVTIKSNSEPPDFGQGVERKDKAQNADWNRDFVPAALRRKAQSADTPSKVVKNEVPATALPLQEEVDGKAQTVRPQSTESKDYSKLLQMTQEPEENFEPKLQENQQEQFKETTGLEGKESDKPQNELTSLMRISSTSSTSTDTSDAHKKEHNVENDRFWILEKGWGRFSKYKKPNFIRFDFIKVR